MITAPRLHVIQIINNLRVYILHKIYLNIFYIPINYKFIKEITKMSNNKLFVFAFQVNNARKI